jgi:hypothetical protein
VWQLCLLKPLPGKKSSWVEARRTLKRSGYAAIHSQAFLLFQSTYDGQLSRELGKLGFLVSFIPVRPDQVQPAGLQEFIEGSENGLIALQRRVVEISREVHLLIEEINKKESFTYQR